MSRQGGGIGTLGVGETNTELMKRHWRDSVKRVHDELEKISNTREQQIERRKKSGFKTISIVGYTNAGKSSLFNLLAGKDVLVENALFATLDSTVGKLYLQSIKQEVLITDTIGFIRNLPPRLISAFKSTLLESIHADVLLHVIDVSDPELEIKIEVVNKILQELGRDSQDVVYVFNKVDAARSLDLVAIEEKFKSHSPIFISVKEKSGIENLINVMTTRLRGG
jgi:GTP-binding protein HflX